MPYANNKGADQLNPKCQDWLVSVAEQSGLSLIWLQGVTWLKFCLQRARVDKTNAGPHNFGKFEAVDGLKV